ncbi:hypothetical protein BS78_06G109000 [Paspalum vaginatum]|nr:hypothetical protein BS78_06G109000 [Paspalum vaginatum]
MDEFASAAIFPNKRTPEDVFKDFRGRRAGIVKALTTDVAKFYELCDPEKENLCLYGLSNETWEVTLPAEEVPPELPEPALGINFARDGMLQKDWLSLVAVHSDAWLIAVAFYFGARFGFDKEARRRLYMMINNLPTVFEAVTEIGKKQSRNPNCNGNGKTKSGSKAPKKSSSNSKPVKQHLVKQEEQIIKEDGGDNKDQAYLCGTCGGSYSHNNGDFWIACDVCEVWYHGDCVRITPAQADNINQYKCPTCSNKRIRE